MTHDPLCEWDGNPHSHCDCDLIAKAREDERRQRVALEEVVDYYKAHFHRAEREGWHEGVRECIAAVEALVGPTSYPRTQIGEIHGLIVGALRALEEKP